MSIPAPDIMAYSDYRAYLSAVIQSNRERNPSFGVRFLARRSGFRSGATVSMIVNGKRRLTAEAAEKLARGLNLSGVRKQYLIALAKCETSKTSADRLEAYENLVRLRNRCEERPLQAEQYRMLSSWFYPVVYELLGIAGENQAPSQLAKRIGKGITCAQVVTAISDLKNLNLLVEREGRLYPTESAVVTSDDLKNAAIRKYHFEMLALAQEALSLPVEEREFSGLTVAVTKEALPELKEKIRRFRKELNETLSASVNADEVIQINMQIFPMTEKRKSNETHLN